MTPLELHRLAGAIATLRPDWPAASLQTFIARHFEHRPLRDIALALVAVALDPATTTPARALNAGPWWQTAATSARPTLVNDCPRHPEAQIRVDARTGATSCGGCHADAAADQTPATFTRRPPTEEARAVRATLQRQAGQRAGSDQAEEETA